MVYKGYNLSAWVSVPFLILMVAWGCEHFSLSILGSSAWRNSTYPQKNYWSWKKHHRLSESRYLHGNIFFLKSKRRDFVWEELWSLFFFGLNKQVEQIGINSMILLAMHYSLSRAPNYTLLYFRGHECLNQMYYHNLDQRGGLMV